MKSADYPKDTNEQSAKAVELVKDLVLRVLGREETFSLVVRKSSQRRYAKDSTLVLVPPIEVSWAVYLPRKLRPNKLLAHYLNVCYYCFQVRMTLTGAQEFRTKGAALARAKTEGFAGIYFGQCTTLSTRIRCEV